MSWFDISLIGIIGLFALTGFRLGAIHTLGSVIGTILGVYLASRYYEPMAAFIVAHTGWGGNLPNVIMFVIAFIVINRLVGVVFWFISRVFKLITKLPFISSIDKLIGLLLGVLEGVITIGVIIYFVERFPISKKLMEMIATSNIAEQIRKIANLFIPLLPEGMKLIKSTVNFVEGVFK